MTMRTTSFRIHAFYILTVALVCVLSSVQLPASTHKNPGCRQSQLVSIEKQHKEGPAISSRSNSSNATDHVFSEKEREIQDRNRFERLRAQQQNLPKCARGLLVNLHGSTISNNLDNHEDDDLLCEGFLLRDDLVVVEDPQCASLALTVTLLQPDEKYLMEHDESVKEPRLGTRTITAREIGKGASLVTIDIPPVHHHGGWPRYRSFVQTKNKTKLEASDGLSITCLGDLRFPVIFLTDEGKEGSDSILRANDREWDRKLNTTKTSSTRFLRFPTEVRRVASLYNSLGERWWLVKQPFRVLETQLFARNYFYKAKAPQELDIFHAKGQYASLEPEDPKHRGIANLEIYFDLWRNERPFSGEPFYQWLDFGGGRNKDHPDCPHEKCLNHYKSNEFLTLQEERNKAIVRFEYGRYDEEPVVVYESDNRPVEGGSMLFVWGTDRKVYVTKTDAYKLHHICILSAQPVLMAGEFRIGHHGLLSDVLCDSGHYKPEDRHYISFFRFVMSQYSGLNPKDIYWRKNEYSPIQSKERWYSIFFGSLTEQNGGTGSLH